MSRKHNTRHNRTAGGYQRRLVKRGVSNIDVRMDSLEQLRRAAGRSPKPDPLPEVFFEDVGVRI